MHLLCYTFLYKFVHFIFISSLDVISSPWPEGNTCVGEGRPGIHGSSWDDDEDGDPDWLDWVALGFDLDTVQCEQSCKSFRENGCCYIGQYPGYTAVIGGVGCYWRPGGYSVKSADDIGGISVNVHRSGRNKLQILIINDRYNGPSSSLIHM